MTSEIGCWEHSKMAKNKLDNKCQKLVGCFFEVIHPAYVDLCLPENIKVLYFTHVERYTDSFGFKNILVKGLYLNTGKHFKWDLHETSMDFLLSLVESDSTKFQKIDRLSQCYRRL